MADPTTRGGNYDVSIQEVKVDYSESATTIPQGNS